MGTLLPCGRHVAGPPQWFLSSLEQGSEPQSMPVSGSYLSFALSTTGRDAVATAEAILYRPPAAISVLTDEELKHLIELMQRVIDADESQV